MLENASPDIRQLIVECKSQAMLGEQDNALDKLERGKACASLEIDRVNLLNAKAEILYDSCRDREALQVFVDELDILSHKAPREISIALAYNRSDIELSLFKPDDYYGLIDRSHISEVNLWDYRALHDINEAAFAERHYEALPTVWGELLRTYRQGCWRPFRTASRLMANECLQLRWYDKAVFYAVISQHTDTLQLVGDHLLLNAQAHLLESAVETLITCANQRRYINAGCEIIERMTDAIPDSMYEDKATNIL